MQPLNDEKITGTQWKALIAAWLGWCFDGLDGYLYLMVAMPFVTRLLHNDVYYDAMSAADPKAFESQVTQKAAIIQGFFLIGWAVGGAVFGRIGDRLGRARTLTLTVLTYAIFTGAAFFATQWWHLLIFRFIAALGIGGEWAAGSALVCETLHTRHRAWASATLQSGYMVGCIAAALTAGALKGVEPKYVFLIGIAPALMTVWIRWAVPEPEQWTRECSQREPPPVSALFSRELRRTTLMVTALTSIALTTVWAFLYFQAQQTRNLPEMAAHPEVWTAEKKQALVSNVSVAYLTVNIAANYFATYLAHWAGYRFSFLFLMAGALVVNLWVYSHPVTPENVYLVNCLVAFFGLGLFGMFPLYIPPLFPTLVRTLGAGFTYNVGRLFSAGGAFAGGWIAAKAGGFGNAIWWTSLLYIPGLLICLFIPEPPGDSPGDEARESKSVP